MRKVTSSKIYSNVKFYKKKFCFDNSESFQVRGGIYTAVKVLNVLIIWFWEIVFFFWKNAAVANINCCRGKRLSKITSVVEKWLNLKFLARREASLLQIHEVITSLVHIEVACKTSCMFAAAGKLECGPPHNSASASAWIVAVYT